MMLKKKKRSVDGKGWAALGLAVWQVIEAHHREILEILSRLPHPVAEQLAPSKPTRTRRLVELSALVLASGVGVGFALGRRQH